MNTQNWIVIPVYNDWESLKLLMAKLKNFIEIQPNTNYSFLFIDDCSTILFNAADFIEYKVVHLRLRRNLGHQRAIASGLSYLNSLTVAKDAIIVMDADGEDDPDAARLLLEASKLNPGKIIFSSRSKRQEPLMFRAGYHCYKSMFRILTGKKISFGNFSLIPGAMLNSIVNISEIWNHYSGGILKAGLPYHTIPVPRGKRYTGNSSMNLVSLILHGLRAMAVYIDRIAARLLLFFVFIAIILGAGILIVLYFKYFTSLAIPGWATTALSGLLILLFQSLLMSLFIVFIVLNQNTQRQIIPAIDFKDYIEEVDTKQDATL
ncbi:MAG: glycosyltransferase [Bacteroidales bacterium]